CRRSRGERGEPDRAGDDVRPPARRERGRDRPRDGRRARGLSRRARRAGDRDLARDGDGPRVERRRSARKSHVAAGAARHRAHARFPAATGGAMKGQRRLALGVLLGAGVLAIAAFPVRETWWGGWILAIAEAGIVGGLADWFAVTAIFRRPLGLPIPHTGLIPANWELMAERVGTMVGSRVLTRENVVQEIARVDLAGLIERAAERLTRRGLDAATRALARWLAAEPSPQAAAEGVARLRDALLRREAAAPVASAPA